ncbi:MAG: hypothetical protein K2Q45_05320 [Nitrosomonas sp.]|nr:hypothetical protein [Nitrosomonas sp.]
MQQQQYKITIHEEIKAIEFARRSGIQEYIALDVNDDQKTKLFDAGYSYVCMRNGLTVLTWLKDNDSILRLRKELNTKNN